MNIEALKASAKSIRALSIDGVQAANSGHPGLPLGCADLGAYLFGYVLKHNPAHSQWAGRDRFVLSAGHGSMFLYSILHLTGYDVSIDDLKNFRQMGSKTPGHPEYGYTDGVETTTGPLGQGISNAVGMALASKMLAERFNTPKHTIIDNTVYSIAGDGCLMEGISAEAASFAGHNKLDNLVVFYDSNSITIEGSTDLAFTEDVGKRFEAYGWNVLEGSAHDFEEIQSLVEKAKNKNGKPTLVILESIIGFGSPNKAGTHGVHGAPLGEEEVILTREGLGIPVDQDFYVDPAARDFFEQRKKELEKEYNEWNKQFDAWSKTNPDLKKQWDLFFAGAESSLDGLHLPQFKTGEKLATRKASGAVLKALAKGIPNLVGGSADLAPSNNTALPDYGSVNKGSFAGRTIHFGVREHAMGAIVNGMLLYGGFRVFCATFLVFADYMRPAIRLASLMKLPAIYVFTHDSVFLGEDGPTHQPIEHLASLRIIPGLTVLRPADAQETASAWLMAVKKTDGPVVFALTRQGLETFEKADPDWQTNIQKGAYIAHECDGTPETVIVATGSEVSLAISAAKDSSKKVRVVSMLSREIFLEQDKAYQNSLLPEGVKIVACEAGVTFGWECFTGCRDNVLGIDRFGESGPGPAVADHLGINKTNLLNKL